MTGETLSADLSGYVPKTRKVNGKQLDSDVTLNASDVNARPNTWVPSDGFTVILTAAGWTEKVQTISDTRFITAGFSYIVSPASANFSEYANAVIYADDVITDGIMTFHCTETPTADISVNVLRTEANE